MARLTILTPKEIHTLYGLSQFTDEERDAYFALDPREKQAVKAFRTFTAKTYFILQLGYFKAKKQIFVFDLQTVADDVAYILHRHFPHVASLSDPAISKPTRLAQQAEILRLFDYQVCSQEWKRKLQEKAGELAAIYTKPVYIFKELANFLGHHRVVLPGYSFLQEKIIGRAITGEQNRLEKAVRVGIPEEQRIQLDNLLTAEESLYQLTLLKREPKDFSHQEVQKEVAKRTQLTDLYHLATQFLPNLHVSNENIKYYASLVSYYPVKDIRKMSREIAHAYLLCFISYRYQMVNDNLVNTFLYHVNKFIEGAKEAAKEQMAKEKLEANQRLRDAGKILDLFTDETIPDETNFGTVKQKAFTILEKEKFPLVSQYLTKAVLDETAYEWQQYVRFSVRFKLHLRHLFLAIPFESQIKDDPILKAVAFLQEAFQKDKSLRDYSQQAFPKECIPEKKKYLYEIKPIPWYGKTKNRRMLNADKYEFLVYKLLKLGLDAGDLFIRDKSIREDFLEETEDSGDTGHCAKRRQYYCQ